ncbi:patched family protein [Dictyocaulus viviparus]|uniref:Patched family protein n=1 Tax=Dictyocaulus viviparus TaxID=29172 RepID=A0A0D8XGA8_DICVI|nr:patched family protein [Dictyocaulus viviparus]
MEGIRPKRQSILIGQRSLDVYGEAEQGPKFVLWVISVFRRWGFIIADHSWLAIALCLAISGLSMVKVVLTPQRNEITGYTPYGARAKDEFLEYQNFFSAQGLPVAPYLFVVAKDNGSMIRPEYLRETVQNGYMILVEPGAEPTSRIKLNYPLSSVFGRVFSLQPNFFGVELYNDTNDEDDVPHLLVLNKTDVNREIPRVTNMKSVKMLAMQFRAEHKPGWLDTDVKQWEMKMVEIFERNYHSDLVKVYAYSQSYVEEEMVRGGIIMIPYLVVGFAIMCVCSVASVMIRALYMHQENCYKIILAIMACLTPLLACSTALALMFICGVRFASILCVIPFLVLSIGVDSSYLMIHEWQRVTEHMRESPKKKDSVGHRLSEVLSEVGPAILISCLTNMFADAVGSFTSSPEITLLCTGNMLSMCMAFIYQMTFYAGLMTIVGSYEINEDINEKNRMAISIAENRINIARHHRPLTRQPSKFHEATKPMISKFMKEYVGFMTTPVVYIGIFLIYIAYLAFSIWVSFTSHFNDDLMSVGITIINISLTATKLFAMDSPLLELDKYRITYQVPSYSMATVFITNPDFRLFNTALNHRKYYRLVEDMENLKGKLVEDMENLKGKWGENWGPVGTKFFMRDYANFHQTFADDTEDELFEPEDLEFRTTTPETLEVKSFNDDELKYFLKWPEYDYWSGFVKLKNDSRDGEEHLDRFFFTTGFHGKPLSDWNQRGEMLHEWRKVIDNYSEFNPSVFHEDGVYLDLIDNMTTDTWQSVLGTLVCMAFVCFIFLNNLFTVAIASLSVLSICAGILGILSWWGVDLDPITMAATIISIGFSVDIPAHVSYHYHQASLQEGPTSRPADRLANCLSSVAFPAVQAALSTILCVCSLLFVNLYMAGVFVKTMTLCVVLCNLHGLVFLPAILIMIDAIKWRFRPKGAAAQRKLGKTSRTKQKNSRIAPEKSFVTDRPEI